MLQTANYILNQTSRLFFPSRGPSCVWLTEMSLLAAVHKHADVFVLIKQIAECEGLVLSHAPMNVRFQKNWAERGKEGN